MLTELIRLGRDSSVKQLDSGTSVANLACAYDVGYGDNKRTQWLELAVFGKQAEALSQYFTKGRQFMITAKDVCTEEYEKRDGSGLAMRLKATAVELKFAGPREDNQAPQQQFGAQPQYQQPAQQQQNVAPQQHQQPATQHPAQQQNFQGYQAPPAIPQQQADIPY